jgi:hypothetical protein
MISPIKERINSQPRAGTDGSRASEKRTGRNLALTKPARHQASQGLIIAAPQSPKPFLFGVAMTRSCSMAVAAIKPFAVLIEIPFFCFACESRSPVRDGVGYRQEMSFEPIRNS